MHVTCQESRVILHLTVCLTWYNNETAEISELLLYRMFPIRRFGNVFVLTQQEKYYNMNSEIS